MNLDFQADWKSKVLHVAGLLRFLIHGLCNKRTWRGALFIFYFSYNLFSLCFAKFKWLTASIAVYTFTESLMG